MKKPTAAVMLSVMALPAALMLAGCSPEDLPAIEVPAEPTTKEPYVHYTFEQELPDGGVVLCVWAQEGYRNGGLSCDWEGVER